MVIQKIDLMSLFNTDPLAQMALIGLVGGPLAGVFALGIFTRRANSAGAIVGIVVSTITLYLVQQFTAVHFFLYGAVGILTCFVAGYAVSIIASPVVDSRGSDLEI